MKQIPASLFLIVLMTVLSPCLSGQANQAWPSYRGPSRDGSIDHDQWSSFGATEALWKTNVGRGYSSPSCLDGRLVTFGFDEEKGLDRITCFDASSGKKHWEFSFPESDDPMFHAGGTLGTPTLHQNAVYGLNRKGIFHALRLEDGSVLWKRDFAKELGIGERDRIHGFSQSPLIVEAEGLEGSMILQLNGALARVSTEDGSVIWRTEDRGPLSHANPVLVTAKGRPAVATVAHLSFVVHDLETGELLHHYDWKLVGNAMHCASPVRVGEDRIFLSTAYNKGCALIQLGAETTPSLLWSHRRMRNKVTASVLHRGHLYGFDESMLCCADLEGGIRWRVRGLGLGSLSVVGDRLLILSSDGELIVAEANPEEFREISRQRVLEGGEYWSAPVFVDGLIYVRNSLGDLACLDHRENERESVQRYREEPMAVPEAAVLFSRHRERVGAEELDRQEALQLKGNWSIALRGLIDAPTTWIMKESGAWSQVLPWIRYEFDGAMAWAIEPQGPRLVEENSEGRGEDLFEYRVLFDRRALFAPPCPQGAVTESKPVRFFDIECWKVTVSKSGREGVFQHHYFEVKTGRLVGSDGDGLSTMVMSGEMKIGDSLIVPQRLTRFRAEDGQEHVMTFESAEWIESRDDLIVPPPAIQRLMRSEEEIARDAAALRTQFAWALGSYRDPNPRPGDPEVLNLRVRDGSLYLENEAFGALVAHSLGEDDVYPTEGAPFRVRILRGETKCPGIELLFFEGDTVKMSRID